jgi:hypothetical protein
MFRTRIGLFPALALAGSFGYLCTSNAAASDTAPTTTIPPAEANRVQTAAATTQTSGCGSEAFLQEPSERMRQSRALEERLRAMGDTERARLATALTQDWNRVCSELRAVVAKEQRVLNDREARAQHGRDAAKAQTELEEGFAKLERLRAQLAERERERLGAPHAPNRAAPQPSPRPVGSAAAKKSGDTPPTPQSPAKTSEKVESAKGSP